MASYAVLGTRGRLRVQAVQEEMDMRRRQKGFTLIELLVVMAIIAILASIVVPNIVGWISRARMTRAQAEIKSIELSLAKMLTDAGRDNLMEFFRPVRVRELTGAPETGMFTPQAFAAARQLYTEALYALLREGRGALQADDPRLAPPLGVLKADVVKNLSQSYVDIGFDPWGNLYQIYPAPWPRSMGPNIFRVFAKSQGGAALPGARTGETEDRLNGYATLTNLDFLQTEYQENTVGYPAPRNPAVAFIYSYGANMASGQAIYNNEAVLNATNFNPQTDMYPDGTTPQFYYDTNQELDFIFGGDDINNWDPETSWSRFYN